MSNSREFRILIPLACEVEAFITYIQSLDSTLTQAQATAIAASVIGSLPALFSKPISHQYLLEEIALAKAIWTSQTQD